VSPRLAVGALIGAITGLVVAINVVIFSGSEKGYETSVRELFDRNVVLGVVVVSIVLAGPVVGALVAFRTRDRIRVREATDADISSIATFLREAWQMTGPDAPGWAGADEEVIEHLARSDVLRERIGGPERRLFIAVDAHRVVGFAATRWTGSEAAELAGIVVLQEMVGRGIGTPLLAAALGRLRSDGATDVFVRTESDNERALGFYRSRGFGDERTQIEDVEGTDVEVVELRRPI
jgi:ribosomal protein S18 acetylase RimI-like enzyme